MLQEHSCRDINEWAAYQNIRGPLGPEGADLRAGIIAAAAVSPHCAKGQSVAPIDFMPFVRRLSKAKQRMSNNQLAAVFKQAKEGFAKSAKK